MRRRALMIPLKRVTLLGCEGASERAYAALLNEIARERGMPLAIEARLLKPGAGDPLELVKKTIKALPGNWRRSGTYVHVAVLLDEDKCIQLRAHCAQARALAAEHGVQLVWQ